MFWLRIGKRKIKIQELTSFQDRIKSFRFYLQPITTGLYFPKKKAINTYFFCQRVDILVVDKEQHVIASIPCTKSEKFIRRRRKAAGIYVLPLSSCEHYQIGDLVVTEKK